MAKGMKSLERVYERELCDCCGPHVCGKPEPDYPCLFVDAKQMPEIDSWEVGKTYEIRIRVKLKERSEREKSSNGSTGVLAIEAYEREKSLN